MFSLANESFSWSPKVLHKGLDEFLEHTVPIQILNPLVTNVGPKKDLKPYQHSIKSLNPDPDPH